MGDESDEEERDKRRPQPPPVEFVKSGEPPSPLPPRDSPPAAWVPRPEDYIRPAPTAPARMPGAPGRFHKAAGSLLIVSGLIAIGWTVYLSIRFLSPAEYANATKNLSASEWAIGQICGLIGIWGQSIALLAGAMALLRLHYRFAVGTAVVSSLAISSSAVLFLDPFFGGAAAMGLIGLVLLRLARPEFAS
jgi:hypothetical protein